MPLEALIAVYAALVTAAVVLDTRGRARVLRVVKPGATLWLLLVAGVPSGPLGWLIGCGLLLSAAGDRVLVSKSHRSFLLGLVLFLLAHIGYTGAFVPYAHGGALAWGGGLAACAGAALLVAAVWPSLPTRLRIPAVMYGVGITTMVIAALSTWGGPLPRDAARAAATGAAVFYLSDANLAWARFRGAYRHHNKVTLCLYWTGQLGIALAARWG